MSFYHYMLNSKKFAQIMDGIEKKLISDLVKEYKKAYPEFAKWHKITLKKIRGVRRESK